MAKQFSSRAKKWLSRAVGLPPATMTDVPCLRVTGREELVVENHQGVLAYGPKQIKLNTRCGILHVAGENLRMNRVSGEMLVITGHVDALAYGEGV